MSSGRGCSCRLDCMLAWMESYYPKLAWSLARYIYVWLWKTISLGWSELLKNTKMDSFLYQSFEFCVCILQCSVVSICKEKIFVKLCWLFWTRSQIVIIQIQAKKKNIELKSVHYKNPVDPYFFQNCCYFQYNISWIKTNSADVTLKWQQFWKKWGSRNYLLKMNGL